MSETSDQTTTLQSLICAIYQLLVTHSTVQHSFSCMVVTYLRAAQIQIS